MIASLIDMSIEKCLAISKHYTRSERTETHSTKLSMVYVEMVQINLSALVKIKFEIEFIRVKPCLTTNGSTRFSQIECKI